MNFYCYKGTHPLGEEPIGTADRYIYRNRKSLVILIRRLLSYGWTTFSIYTFTNFYDDSTFKLVYKQ